MGVNIACIAGEEVHRQWEAGRLTGKEIGSVKTPFGATGEIFLVKHQDQSFYLLSRSGHGVNKTAPHKVNYRANMYALKDMGVRTVLGWGAGAAITHNVGVGDMVILSDVIDFTHVREGTYFEQSPLGFLRQFPVFCPAMRKALAEVLFEMKLHHHGEGTAAVTDGPRIETPAEIRMLSTIGAQVVSHTFAPEMFLAKELQMCYAAVCCIVNFAETGRAHRPLAPGDLFAHLPYKSESDRLNLATEAIPRIIRRMASCLAAGESCQCDKTMAEHVSNYKLPKDWRKWVGA